MNPELPLVDGNRLSRISFSDMKNKNRLYEQGVADICALSERKLLYAGNNFAIAFDAL